MLDITHRCVICEADFAPGALDKTGKCPLCRKDYPTVKTREEAFALNRPDIHLGAKLTEDRVRQIAREEFNAIRAEIAAAKTTVTPQSVVRVTDTSGRTNPGQEINNG